MSKKVIKICCDTDLDGTTVREGQGKVHSKLLLTSKTVVVDASDVTNLIFRQTNNSNALMLCTGYQIGEDWHGDRVGDGVWSNPFDGKKYQRTGTNEEEYIETRKPIVIFVNTAAGAEVRITNSYYILDGMIAWNKIEYNGKEIGNIQKSDWKERDGYIYATLKDGTVFSGSSIRIVVDDGRGERVFARTTDIDGRAAYAHTMYAKTPTDLGFDEDVLYGHNTSELFESTN